MDCGLWILDYGCWIMDCGSWILHNGMRYIDHGSWIMDHRLRVMDWWQWIVDYGLQIIYCDSQIANHGLWIMDCDSWTMIEDQDQDKDEWINYMPWDLFACWTIPDPLRSIHISRDLMGSGKIFWDTRVFAAFGRWTLVHVGPATGWGPSAYVYKCFLPQKVSTYRFTNRQTCSPERPFRCFDIWYLMRLYEISKDLIVFEIPEKNGKILQEILYKHSA